jgi:ATP adenylyltransferase
LLQHLSAPWRFAYVSRSDSDRCCIFCAAASGGEETLTVFRGQRVVALLNRFPYTSGHVMVAPVSHVAEFAALEGYPLVELMAAAQRLVKVVEELYHPHGFNLGFNLGEAAGAGIVEHLHLHIVPRWRGDTSFMTTSAGVRVLPESLSDTWSRLVTALGKADG